MSKEIAIYHKTQWKKGRILGAEITDNNMLQNSLHRLDDKSFSNPITSSWTINKDNKFAELIQEGDNLLLKADKSNSEERVLTPTFCSAETNFNRNDLSYNIDYMSINFDWNAYKTPAKETGLIVLSDGKGATHTIELSNQNEINLITYNGSDEYSDYVRDSSPNSIGNIESIINNNLEDWWVDIRLVYDEIGEVYKIETRFRAYGYESIWHSRTFGAHKIRSIEFRLDAIENTNSIVSKELNIKKICLEGYEDKASYITQVFDAGEDNSLWNKIDLKGYFGETYISNSSTNSFRVKVYTSNEIDKISTGAIRDFSINPTRDKNEYSFDLYDETLPEDERDFKGRYLQAEIYPSTNKSYQNSIDFIKFNYDLASDIEGRVFQEVESATDSVSIGVEGGVVELPTSNFPTKLYVPPGAIDSTTTFTITRLATDDTFASDMIGFEFFTDGPHTFNKPLLLEIDYADFKFNTYQSEQGLKIAYIDTEDGPQELKTIIDKNNKKALAYLSHFSTYALVATDNLYSYRTQLAAEKHPRWMKLRDKNSNFQRFMNHGIFSELDKADEAIRQDLKNHFLDLADEQMKYISFKTHASNFVNGDDILNIDDSSSYFIKYKNKLIPLTTSQKEFYLESSEVCLYERETDIIYFEQPYDIGNIEIIKNGNTYYTSTRELERHHIWNVFDEFALLFDIRRLPEENNASLKKRVFDAGINPGNSTEMGLQNHVARELGLSKGSVSINSLKNSSYIKSLKNADGSASEQLKTIASYINNHISIGWDEFRWGEGYWISDIEQEGNYNFI